MGEGDRVCMMVYAMMSWWFGVFCCFRWVSMSFSRLWARVALVYSYMSRLVSFGVVFLGLYCPWGVMVPRWVDCLVVFLVCLLYWLVIWWM